MSPENFLNDIQQVINSIDPNKSFTGEEVKEIFENMKKVILSNFNSMEYCIKAEMTNGEIMIHKDTKMKKHKIKDAVVFEVYETEDFVVDVDSCLETVKEFCEKTGISGMMLPPGIRTLSLVPTEDYSFFFDNPITSNVFDQEGYVDGEEDCKLDPKDLFDDEAPWDSDIPF